MARRVGARRQRTGLRPGFGEPFDAGPAVVMQVHYNLLAGKKPDRSAAELRLAPASDRITPLVTQLFPAPVELPCREGHQRREAVRPRRRGGRRQGAVRRGPGSTADLLHLLCGADQAGASQSCTRPVPSARPSAASPATCTCSATRSRSRSTPARRGADAARHPGLGLRQPGQQADQARAASSPATPSGSPAATARGCATGCRRSRAARTSTSCGARAPPTRCAWASSWSRRP